MGGKPPTQPHRIFHSMIDTLEKTERERKGGTVNERKKKIRIHKQRYDYEYTNEKAAIYCR